jgi:hypothetical protein
MAEAEDEGPVIACAKALHDYGAEEDDSIPLRVDDIIDVTQKDNSGWWRGSVQGSHAAGFFPSAYVEEICSEGEGAEGQRAVAADSEVCVAQAETGGSRGCEWHLQRQRQQRWKTAQSTRSCWSSVLQRPRNVANSFASLTGPRLRDTAIPAKPRSLWRSMTSIERSMLRKQVQIITPTIC